MKIAFESDLLVPPVSKAISILTDGAKVCVDDIHYDEAKGIVNIYMQRIELTGFKKSFLGEMQPVYSQTMIKSLLTIRQVEEVDIKVDDILIAECNSCFRVFFGLKMDKNELYLGSLEETQGKILCQISIKVKEMSIELGDEVKKSATDES
jgi:hypothetical protein